MTSSLTTALEELKRENYVLKTDNATMKDENKQLTTALDKMAVNNKDQVQQINSQNSEIAIMKNENKQLRTNNATMMDEIVKLKTESDIIKAENVELKASLVDISRSLHPPPVAIQHKLQVSRWLGITQTLNITIHKLIMYIYGCKKPLKIGGATILSVHICTYGGNYDPME